MSDIKEIKNNVAILEALTNKDVQEKKSPAHTVSAFVEAVGYENALETIGTLINRHGWDGRISKGVVEWAKGLENTVDEEEALRVGIYTNIHMAHLNQLAEAMKNF